MFYTEKQVDSTEDGEIDSTALFSGSSEIQWLSGWGPMVSLGTLFQAVYLPS